MSVIKFELKKVHVDLLRQLRWTMDENKFIVSAENLEDDAVPFGLNSVYEAVDLIINGKPDNFDVMDVIKDYTNEQIEEWNKLLLELPTALDIILYNSSFELGHYKTKYHERNWKKIQSVEKNKDL
jgi:hypothetical protein